MSFIEIPYPLPAFKYKTENNKQNIFCLSRKRYVALTPEEWVRQNFLAYLTKVLKYPVKLISVEKKIIVGAVSKRYDIVVYNADFEPFILVECKQTEIAITEQTLFQLITYFKTVEAPYWVLTNGIHTCCAHFSGEDITWEKHIPSYTVL